MIENEINLLYQAHKGAPTKHFDGPEGKVFTTHSRDPERHNVALSWYAIKDPKPEDSILILEPFCIHPTDYNIKYLQKFKHVFTWTGKAFRNTELENKVIEVNHPNMYKFPVPDNLIAQWKPWKERADKLVIIANDKSSQHASNIYKLRTLLAANLSINARPKVEWYGQKTPRKPYSVGPVGDKIELLRSVKFTVCSENCYDERYSHNYFTEKMMHAWMGGAVPLYMGCHNIDDLFPKEAYIDLRPFVKKNGKDLKINFEAIKNKINNFTEDDYNKMMDAVKEIIKDPNGMYHVCSWPRVHKKMLEVMTKK